MAQEPALFISHGSPLTVITEDLYAEKLRSLGARLRKPRAVVVVSAHCLSEDGSVEITSSRHPRLIYDFGGFPEELYRYRYPCPGAPELAAEISKCLSALHLTVTLNLEGGLDHGVWVPLARLFPEADVPVIQVSMPFPSNPMEVVAMGRVLSPLRDSGVLLVGSGGAVHNLHALNWHNRSRAPDRWAVEFNEWLKERVESKAITELLHFERNAPHVHQAHPTTEHFFPLFFTLGAWQPHDLVTTVVDEFQYESLSMYSFMLAAA